MLKERIAETFGPIRYTFGLGKMQQQLISNAYPGLLDGIQVQANFPDDWGIVPEITGCSLLLRYFKSTSPAMWKDVTRRNAVMDNANVDNASELIERRWVRAPGTCLIVRGLRSRGSLAEFRGRPRRAAAWRGPGIDGGEQLATDHTNLSSCPDN